MEPERTYIDFRRRRDVADSINATFHFFREEVGGLFRVLVIIVGPLVVVTVVLAGGDTVNTWSQMFDVEYWLTGEMELSTRYWIGSIVSNVASFLAVAVLYAYAMLYADDPGARVEPRVVWARVRRYLVPFITTILWVIVIFTGLILLNFIPILGTIAWLVMGFYLTPVLALVFSARFDRREAFWTAFRRVRKLLKGNWWSSFGLLVVTFVLIFIVSIGLSAAVMAVVAFVVEFVSSGVATVIGMVVMAVLTAAWYLLYVIPIAAFTIYYFGLVEEQEGVALEAEVDAMARQGGVPIGGRP